MDYAVTRTQRHTTTVHNESGSVWCVFTSTGFGYAAVWRKTASPGQPRSPGTPGLSVHTGHRAGGVLRAYRSHFRFADAPGRMPFTPQARPTIFCASRSRDRSQRHLSPDGTHHCAATKCFTRFGGQATPDNQRNTTPARTSSISTSVFSSKVASSRRFRGYALHLCTGKRQSRRPVQVRDVDFDWQCTRVFHRVKKMGAILPPRHKPPPRLFGTVEYHRP